MKERISRFLKTAGKALIGSLGLAAILLGLNGMQLKAQEEPEELKVVETFPVNGGQDVFHGSGLEITFNTDAVSQDALREAVSASPEVSFYVANGADDNTLVLAPYGWYEPETKYTVTIHAGLTADDGKVLKEDVVFSFSTASEDLVTYEEGLNLAPAGQGNVVNALTNESPAFFLLLNSDTENAFSGNLPEANVTLYRFDTDEGFLRALLKKVSPRNYRREGKEDDPSAGEALQETATFPVTAEKVENGRSWWWYQEYVITFPEPLEEGHYLARLDFPVKTDYQEFVITRYMLVQSTEISAFTMTSGNEAAGWLHNGITGEALDGADIRLCSSWKFLSGTTEENGYAVLSADRGKEEEYRITVTEGAADHLPYGIDLLDIKAGEHRFLEALSNYTLSYGYGSYDGASSRNYYTYLYTDRQIYQTTDEISFFGVLKPRNGDTRVPERVQVVLNDGWWGADEIASVEVSVDEDGCFTGTISYEDQQPVYYAQLSVKDKEGYILENSDGFRIEEYIKPTYKTSSTTDKPVYVLGWDKDEEVVVGISVRYFDETPAGGIHLTQEWTSGGLTTSYDTLTANQDGYLEDHVAFRPSSFPDTWRPQTATISYESEDIEDEKLYISQDVKVIPRDVMLTAEKDPEEEILKISTYAIDTSKILEEKDLYDSENLKGDPLSLPVSGTVFKCWYEKIFDGMRYDYIYKRSYEEYHYVYHEDVVDSCVIETVNGEGTYAYHFEQDEENPACYYIKLVVPDSADRSVSCTAGLSYRSLSRYMNVSRETTYRLKALSEEESPDELFGWYNWTQATFSEAEPAAFVLVKNGEEFELPEGADILSATVQTGFANVETGNEKTRSVAFSEDLLPNYSMVGAYFDGANTWPLEATPMTFDYETRNLDISIEGESDTYRPGETITLSASVLRADTKEPVPAGTKVALGVVDEAVFALEDQEIRVLETLYAGFGISYSTYSSRNTNTPSESGTDGIVDEEAEMAPAPSAANGLRSVSEEQHVRSDFRDTAYFAMAETNEDGVAQFTFPLPDNMTSWRLSVIAVTDDVWAGSTVKDIICTSPYYTVPVLNDIMLEGDSFAIGLRSAGWYEEEGGCQYEVSVRRQGEEEVLFTGSAHGETLRDYTWVTFEGLTEGEYVVRITGICGEYVDVSEYPFEVVRSGLQAYASVTTLVDEMPLIHPLRYPVELTVYDKNAYVYNAVLGRLMCSRDIRADERIGAHFAMTVMAQNGSEYFAKRLEDHDISDLRYIFPLFSYAKNNAEISALAYLAAPEMLSGGVIRGITPEDIGGSLESLYTGSPYAAYLLQALAGEASDGLAELVNQDGLAFRDRIYLMAALFTAGDEEAAEAAYDAFVTPYLESTEAVSGEVVYFLNVDENTTVQDDVAAALIMASLLHRDEARGLALYLLEKPSDKNIYPLEEVLFLKNCEEKDLPPCTVSYMLDGKEHTEQLKGYHRTCLSLQKKALEELNLTTVSGEPYVTIFYIAGLEELTDMEDKKLTAEVSFDKEVYAPGDEAKVTITPGIGNLDPSIGCSTMLLDVYIPSGMRFERYTPDDYSHGNHWYLISREGQRLRFVIFDGSGSRTGVFRPVTFTASCVTPGDYVVECVYLSSNHYDTWGLSERGMVRVSE